jgi:hypothetical protein
MTVANDLAVSRTQEDVGVGFIDKNGRGTVGRLHGGANSKIRDYVSLRLHRTVRSWRDRVSAPEAAVSFTCPAVGVEFPQREVWLVNDKRKGAAQRWMDRPNVGVISGADPSDS